MFQVIKAEFVDGQENLYLGQLNEDRSGNRGQSIGNEDVELPVDVTILSGLPKQGIKLNGSFKRLRKWVPTRCFFGADWSVAK